MASFSFHFLVIFFCVPLLILASESRTTNFKPNKLVLPVHKDGATNLHVASIHKRIPQTLLQLVVDLNGRFMWVNCEKNYFSSTYQAPLCHSTLCSRANSDYCFTCSSKLRPGCHNNTCGLMSRNPISQQAAMGELAQDVLSIQSISTKGFQPGPMVMIPQFLFVCAPSTLVKKGLPKNVDGVAGLGHAPIALPTQLASNLGFTPNFALCLTSNTRKNGVIFFGEGPFYMLPGISVPQSVGYAPLIISKQGEYYIDVRSIKINQKIVPLNKSLLTINKRGFGGTMISTTSPYTVLEHSIYQIFTKVFASQFSAKPLAKPVAPFGLCYDLKNVSSTRIGPGVPKISFVFSDQNVVWTFFGANSMVEASPGVVCLGFVDAGLHPTASIVIGAHQLEDQFLQFDLARSRFGFSYSLLLHRTNCANFNFTTTP